MSTPRPTHTLLLCAALAMAAGANAAPGASDTATPATSPQPFVLTEGSALFTTQYATLRVDAKGFVTSIQDRASKKEYSPAGHPSAILGLHENGQPNGTLLTPTAAAFDAGKKEIKLTYGNGAVAVVKAEAKDGYFRFQLVSLEPRGKVDAIVWGPLNTTISGRIGDLIGVVRSDDFAIGLYGLDDNTISGPVTDGDCYNMGYTIHSPDPVKCPLPANLKEGQWLNIGGDGVSDAAFFSHPEEYYQYACGNGAKIEPTFGSSVAYSARDRTKPHVHLYSLLPGFADRRPRHMVSDPIPGVDFIGSAVALYACPDDLGLKTLEKITLAEGLPYITNRDGKWIRDPATYRPTVYWDGPVDKAIEYTKALGLTNLTRNTGEYYPGPVIGPFIEGKGYEQTWGGRRLNYADGRLIHYKEFGELAHKEGLTHGGLHAMHVFLKGSTATAMFPRLQTICRTKLAKDISATDTEIVVTDPSFLAEKGNWAAGDTGNYLRIGNEMLIYKGISESAPWTLTGIKRGHSSQAAAHKAGDELAKLQQNVYNSFLPDMPLMLDYADYYASAMVRNNMDAIDFDGFEGALGGNHGYYAVRVFCRRFFDTYHKLSGGKWPIMTTSNVFPGAWEYLAFCPSGGARAMNPVTGKRGTQGKDLGNGWSNSWFPATMGGTPWRSDWSLYDLQNLQAKTIGWDANLGLNTNQKVLDRTGDRDAMFKAFRTWQEAREAQVFTKAHKEKLRDPDLKFNLTRTDATHFLLQTVKELKTSGTPKPNAAGEAAISNPYDAQPMQFNMHPTSPVSGCVITLPGGGQITSDRKIEATQFIICNGSEAYVADNFRKKLFDLKMTAPATLPKGECKLGVQCPDAVKPRFDVTVWALDKGETLEAGK